MPSAIPKASIAAVVHGAIVQTQLAPEGLGLFTASL